MQICTSSLTSMAGGSGSAKSYSEVYEQPVSSDTSKVYDPASKLSKTRRPPPKLSVSMGPVASLKTTCHGPSAAGSEMLISMLPSVIKHVGSLKSVVYSKPGTTNTVSVVAQLSKPMGSTNATYSVGVPSNSFTVGCELFGLVKLSAGSQFQTNPQASRPQPTHQLTSS